MTLSGSASATFGFSEDFSALPGITPSIVFERQSPKESPMFSRYVCSRLAEEGLAVLPEASTCGDQLPAASLALAGTPCPFPSAVPAESPLMEEDTSEMADSLAEVPPMTEEDAAEMAELLVENPASPITDKETQLPVITEEDAPEMAEILETNVPTSNLFGALSEESPAKRKGKGTPESPVKRSRTTKAQSPSKRKPLPSSVSDAKKTFVVPPGYETAAGS